MKSIRRHLVSVFLTGLVLLGLAGCGESSGSGSDYNGNWHGTTSHGGSVVFTVVENVMVSLKISDAEANLWIQNPVEIVGHTFATDNFEMIAATGNPAVSARCTFDSPTHASGSYSIAKASRTWTGTFEATKQ